MCVRQKAVITIGSKLWLRRRTSENLEIDIIPYKFYQTAESCDICVANNVCVYVKKQLLLWDQNCGFAIQEVVRIWK
jgi:hypothetical protein